MANKGVGEEFEIFCEEFFPVFDEFSRVSPPTSNPFAEFEDADKWEEKDLTMRFVRYHLPSLLLTPLTALLHRLTSSTKTTWRRDL